jgi:YegS/Rv2252/BmrU family lipid kinase
VTVPVSERRLLIIFNPTAGARRRRRFEAVLAELRRLGCEVTVRPTGDRGDAEQLAASADPNRYDVVVVAGGDGTVNEVINGLAGARLPLAIVPLGTANVLAAEIGMATDARTVARTIALGRPRPISVGVANGRRFLLMAGTGFDAHVVQHVDLALKRRIGKAAYALQILRQLRRFAFPEYTVTIDGASWKAASVLVANAHFYGGRFVCAPAADLRTPSLEVCMFERRGRLSVIGYALAMLAGRLQKLRSYRIVSASKVHIDGGSEEPVQGDGDIIGHLDVTIEVVPEALHLVYPPAAAEASAAARHGRAALTKAPASDRVAAYSGARSDESGGQPPGGGSMSVCPHA